MKFLSGLLTPLIALLAVWIAYQQYVINRRQHRLTLLERRLAVFNATAELIAVILQKATVELNELFDFLRKTREHEFLFGPEVGKYINEIYSRGLELRTRNAVRRAGDIPKITELLDSFSSEMKRARAIFLKYIDLRKP